MNNSFTNFDSKLKICGEWRLYISIAHFLLLWGLENRSRISDRLGCSVKPLITTATMVSRLRERRRGSLGRIDAAKGCACKTRAQDKFAERFSF